MPHQWQDGMQTGTFYKLNRFRFKTILDALELIEKLKATYASVETYRDAGVTLASDALTAAGSEPRQHFRTFFRKPFSYRCQCHYQLDSKSPTSPTEKPAPSQTEKPAENQQSNSAESSINAYQKHLLESDGIIWSDGNESKHYSRVADKTEVFQDPASLFGPSLDPIFKGKAQIPDLLARLLMPSIFKDYDQFPLAKEYWTAAPAEIVGDRICVPVTQDLMVYKETLWICTSDYTMRRHTRDIDYSFLDHPKVKGLINTGSKMLRYFFKQFPDINKEILERGPRHYRTEFEEIVLNQPIEDEQLAFR